MAEQAKMGVVVIGRNEGERLKRCLRSIPPEMLSVYVDSGSTDDSLSFARSLGLQVVSLDLTLPFTAARARNVGVSALLAMAPVVERIQFVDGDCEFERGWFEAAGGLLDSCPQVAVVCGRRRERFPFASFYNTVIDEEWNTPVGEAKACGGDALYRRSAFEEVGGFDPKMVAGEEPEICDRLRRRGWIVWRIDCPMTIHDADITRFEQWWMRSVRCGFGYAQVWSSSRKEERPLYGRELARALGWTVGILSIAALLTIPLGGNGLFFAPLAWMLQWIRLSSRKGARRGALLVVGKAAELYGALSFFVGRAFGRKRGAIFYK